MKKIEGAHFTGERAMFQSAEAQIVDSVFDDGESPLKHSQDLLLQNCVFGWKYPLWYCKNIDVESCTWKETGRAGVWYSDNITVKNCQIDGPKNFRRCDGLYLEKTNFSNAAETLWQCRNITMKDVYVKGDYFAMNCGNITVDGLTVEGNYSFDGVENVVVRNSRLLSKDAFWNSKNVTVYDSYICGEYLGWNSENLILVRCTIESLQGMCYIENLKMIDCKTENTTFAFEYATVDAEISSSIDSILNPASGQIKAQQIGELILEKDKIDPAKTQIICQNIGKRSEKPTWE